MITIPPLEWVALVRCLKVKHIKKDSFFFRQGENVFEIGYVQKGLLYNFYTDEDGNELVKYFISSGKLVAAYSSLILSRPAIASCKALEDTTIITIQYEDLLNLYKRHACWERMGRLGAEEQFVEKEIREYQFLANTASERYNFFVRENPDLINRIPQYLIASFLGISPVSLSRLRNPN